MRVTSIGKRKFFTVGHIRPSKFLWLWKIGFVLETSIDENKNRFRLWGGKVQQKGRKKKSANRKSKVLCTSPKGLLQALKLSWKTQFSLLDSDQGIVSNCTNSHWLIIKIHVLLVDCVQERNGPENSHWSSNDILLELFHSLYSCNSDVRSCQE